MPKSKTMTKRIHVILLFVLCISTRNSAFAQEDSLLVAELKAFLVHEKVSDNLSGVILVARDDRVLFSEAYGFADRTNNVPNRIHTKFRIASMTKMFTGVAIAQLASSNRLHFSDSVRKLLPSLSTSWSSTVTLHQLLIHTSGLGSM